MLRIYTQVCTRYSRCNSYSSSGRRFYSSSKNSHVPVKGRLRTFRQYPIVKYPIRFVRLTLRVLGTTLRAGSLLAVSYATFCGAYSLASPKEWHLSEHSVLLTGIVRVLRTFYNAACVYLAYKYMFWGVEIPEGEGTDAGFGRKDEEVLTIEQVLYREKRSKFWALAGERIAHTMISNGGIFIKVGQGMATFSAMLPAELATALQPLLSNVFERRSGEVEHMFKKDLGAFPDQLFAEFNSVPIAGASIAQVFVGKTHQGEKIAVKVQYFDISKRFKMDKGTIMTLLRIVDFFDPGVPFLRIMPHIFSALEKELDFTAEGRNSEKCKEGLKNLSFLCVPGVFWDLSSKRILTMEFAEGISLVDTDKIKSDGHNSKDIIEKVIRIFSEQIFRTGLIHCDPHPGNILARKSKSGSTEIVLIDHGLYEQLRPSHRQAFAKFWHSIIVDEYEDVQESGAALGLKHPDMLATLLFFKPYGSMKKLGFGFGHGGGGRVKREDMTEEQRELMRDIREMGHETLDNLPENLALIFRNIRLIQGINLSFGVPVNRARLMAGIAVRNSSTDSGLYKALKLRAKFEWHFFILDMRNRLVVWAAWCYSWLARNRVEDERGDISKAALFLQA